MKAHIINIGDEILLGDTVNTNASWMASQLDQSGVEVKRVIVIGDNANEIIKSLKEALKEVELVLFTGGLGPTHDDITKHILCEFFQDHLVENQQVLQDVIDMVARNGKEVNDLNKSQAMVPSKCEVIRNSKGTAPGMIFENEGKTVVSMPGVPYEMKGMMTQVIIPRLQSLRDIDFHIHRHIRTFGIAESALAELLRPVLDSINSEVKLAFLPSPGHVKLRLTAKGKDRKKLETIIRHQEDQFLKYIEEYVYGNEKDTIEQSLSELLIRAGKTLSTAESCTGGKIASKLTSISGSSNYFKGSVVAYSNQIKSDVLHVPINLIEEFGVVSEEVVSAMAAGVKKLFGTDYAIATSGIAGPNGGTKEKPVGTIWVAICHDRGIITKKLKLRFNRLTNIDLTADYTLNMLRKELKKGLIDR